MTNLDSSEKILIEKRKRHQTYMALDYLLSVGTYFDFFSTDAFNIIKNAKYFAQLENKSVNTDLLFLAYFSSDSITFSLLQKSEFINNLKDLAPRVIPDLAILEQQPLESKSNALQRGFRSLSLSIKNLIIKPKAIKKSFYSREVLKIFEKAADNALTRFKTPVITPEILFFTLLENRSEKIGKIIRNCFLTELEWYVFRYNLIKAIHKEESNIRSEVTKNQQYFAYLMKTQLPGAELNRLIDTLQLEKGVLVFRNSLVLKMLEVDLFETFLEDVRTSIKLTTKRKYSS
jgi:hypothetical protein